MKRTILALLLVIGSTSLIVADVQAKRFGSRSSVGRQSTNVTRQAQPATPQQAAKATTPNAATAATAPKPASPWKGIVGGLIGGALLAGLFSSLGLGGALSGMLGSILTFALIGGVIFFLFRMFSRKNQNNAPSAMGQQFQPAYAGSSANALPEIGSGIQQNAPKSFQTEQSSISSSNFGTSGVNGEKATWEVPADFDVPAFLRHAKSNFIRLQAAWDKADLVDIREFTSPEVFAEMKMQLQERGAEENMTDVVTIDAELLGIETQANDYLASVKFTGSMKESANAPAEAFAEVWNLAKPVNGQGGWILAGIQQIS